MKYLSKICLLLILSGIVMLNATCEKRLFKKITYQGYVYDSIGGKPSLGATVYLYAANNNAGSSYGGDNYLVGQSTTDASGHFYIHEAEPRHPWYCISVNTSNCFPYGADLNETKLYLK